MVFTLPPLPWAECALAPLISAETIQYHYGKHHAAYVNKLNELIKGTSWEKNTLEDIIKNSDGILLNQAAQAWNHTFYWHSLSPNGGGQPSGPVASLINKTFGNYNTFKDLFTKEAMSHFGSGWAWLCYNKETEALKIEQTHDAGSPIRENKLIPLLTCDVWEHAYYIDYRNVRAQYLNAWWSFVNWDFANNNLKL